MSKIMDKNTSEYSNFSYISKLLTSFNDCLSLAYRVCFP